LNDRRLIPFFHLFSGERRGYGGGGSGGESFGRDRRGGGGGGDGDTTLNF